jgi:hypothetical protein
VIPCNGSRGWEMGVPGWRFIGRLGYAKHGVSAAGGPRALFLTASSKQSSLAPFLLSFCDGSHRPDAV